MRSPKKAIEQSVPRRPPAKTAAGREQQLIGLAVDLAEKQLAEGTASSQVISHYLKRSSEKEALEIEILKLNRELIKAKTETIQSAKRTEELYKNALTAMRNYGGQRNDEDDED